MASHEMKMTVKPHNNNKSFYGILSHKKAQLLQLLSCFVSNRVSKKNSLSKSLPLMLQFARAFHCNFLKIFINKRHFCVSENERIFHEHFREHTMWQKSSTRIIRKCESVCLLPHTMWNVSMITVRDKLINNGVVIKRLQFYSGG